MLKLVSEMVGNEPRTHPALQFKRLQPCEDAFSITAHKNNSQLSASSSSGVIDSRMKAAHQNCAT